MVLSNPILGIDEFETEFGTLSAAQTATADRLLTLASDYIRGRAPDADQNAAAQVVFEVVRDALNFGAYERLSSFDNETSKRKEQGAFNAAINVNELLTVKHKRLLGIPVCAAPRGSFTKCDY